MSYDVFDYGTLMAGEYNHHLLRHATKLGRSRTRRVYRMVHLGGFPGVVRAQPRQGIAIRGELYSVDNETLGDLDRLEGVPWLYQRTRITLACGTRAYIYLLQDPAGCPNIPSGDWREVSNG